MLKNILKREGGFTLLELLIVIVIIGILALLIIPNVTSAPKKARDTQRKTDLRAIQKALEEYFVSNSAYPSTSGAPDVVLASALDSGTAPIMKTIPKDPNHNATTPYEYQVASGNASYNLYACLENDTDTGTDVVAGSVYTGASNSCTTKTFQLQNAS